MKPETEGKLKYGVWGLIVGAAISMTVGFAWGGWTTASTAQKMNEQAVLASQATICVAQFLEQPNHEEMLDKLDKVSDWERSKFIEKGGWAKMPGQEKSDYSVCQACADGLEIIAKK